MALKTQANWIWYTENGTTATELVLFYREVELSELPTACSIALSADTRYQLFVNGRYVQRGPLRGDALFRYRDKVDLMPYLRKGSNRIAVKVIHYSGDMLAAQRHEAGPVALVSSVHGGLMVEEQETACGFSTDETWYCYPVSAYKMRGSYDVGYANAYECVDGRNYPFGWEQPGAETVGFFPAVRLCTTANDIDVYGVQNMWRLKDRTIPEPFEVPGRFAGYKTCDERHRQKWERFLSGEPVEFEPFSTAFVELNAEDYITGYPVLMVRDGLNTEIKITYAEAYGEEVDPSTRFKYVRDDDRADRKLVYTESDSYCCGRGEQQYSPLYYRTFRFVRLEITTGATPLLLKQFSYIHTGYPLDVQAQVGGNADMERIWNISLRTLRSCIYETYMDCPYFEQMQYVMDTMLQAQYTYPVSNDVRLTKKAMRDFFEAQQPDGAIPCYAPSKYLQIIPCFGLYWIQMIAEYYRRFGDLKEIREYFCGIEKLLNFFDRYIEEDGLYHHAYGWNFVDWVSGWHIGSPVSEPGQVNLLDNLLLLYALKQAEELMTAAGRRDMAAEYGDRYTRLKAAVECVGYDDRDGLYRSATGVSRKSQHAQALAVLAGLVTGGEARSLLERMLKTKGIDTVSFPMLYFLLRALEMTGLYEQAEPLMQPWKECLKLNLFTMPEEAELNRARSDCHAWSALPLYEYTTCYLGVRPADNGKAIAIKPQAVWIPACEGQVVTPQGLVAVRVWQENGRFCVEATAPAVPVRVELPGGTTKEFPRGGHICVSEPFAAGRKRGA